MEVFLLSFAKEKKKKEKKIRLCSENIYVAGRKRWPWSGFIAVFDLWLFLKYLLFRTLVWINECFLDILLFLLSSQVNFDLKAFLGRFVSRKTALCNRDESAAFNLLLWTTGCPWFCILITFLPSTLIEDAQMRQGTHGKGWDHVLEFNAMKHSSVNII